jgi:hypothetical protein
MTNPQWTLLGSGRRANTDWVALGEALPDVTAAWADLDGFHISSLPPTAPLSTHLWAWAPGLWLRVRLDQPHWWAALLRASAPTTACTLWQQQTLPDVAIEPILHWPPSAGQIAQRRISPEHALATFQMAQLTPLLPGTATFLGTADTLSSP